MLTSLCHLQQCCCCVPHSLCGESSINRELLAHNKTVGAEGRRVNRGWIRNGMNRFVEEGLEEAEEPRKRCRNGRKRRGQCGWLKDTLKITTDHQSKTWMWPNFKTCVRIKNIVLFPFKLLRDFFVVHIIHTENYL